MKTTPIASGPIRRSRRATVVRSAAAAVAAVAGLGVLVEAPAQAHAELISSSPTDGASIDVLTTSVSFTFDENISAPAYVAVTAPDGSSIITGSPQITNATIRQTITPVDERGVYTMSYRAVSADGHPVSGSLTFTVTSGRAVTQHSAAPVDGGHGDHGSTGSAWSRHSTEIVVTIVVVVLGAALLIGSGATARGRGDAS